MGVLLYMTTTTHSNNEGVSSVPTRAVRGGVLLLGLVLFTLLLVGVGCGETKVVEAPADSAQPVTTSSDWAEEAHGNLPVPGEMDEDLVSPDGLWRASVTITPELSSSMSLSWKEGVRQYPETRPVTFSPKSNILVTCTYNKDERRGVPYVVFLPPLGSPKRILPRNQPGWPKIEDAEYCPGGPYDLVEWKGDHLRYGMASRPRPDIVTLRFYEVDMDKYEVYRVTE